ncbi:MAG TPA: peptide-methionine (S)-S-oxide reductase MsrA [Mycobacteriales bacterium]|jgi:peptide-methionine (S)-S-oxide reductase|nr:peptide-methionine (S)-S-oxide reductase MsrA [Mycobacteriales bacterium]
MWFRKPSSLPTPEQALPGRSDAIALPARHEVLGTPLAGPYPDGLQVLDLGLGCFWGAERIFWQTPGVHTTLVGYAGGITPNPTYEETCTGLTGHAEVVRVVYDPAVLPTEALLRLFFESHDPTQGMRQGNDVGTTYRSALYTHTDEQLALARAVRETYQAALTAAGEGAITTEILPSSSFYPAEAYHQQYLHKVPNGYCGIGGTGVSCPIGTGVAAQAQ